MLDLDGWWEPALTNFYKISFRCHQVSIFGAKIVRTDNIPCETLLVKESRPIRNFHILPLSFAHESITTFCHRQDRYPTKVDLEVKDTFHTTGYRWGWVMGCHMSMSYVQSTHIHSTIAIFKFFSAGKRLSWGSTCRLNHGPYD